MAHHDFSAMPRPMPRRAFFRAAGATAATSALLLAGCGKDDTPTPDPTITPTTTLTYAAGDAGVLNYLYSLVQLEYAFYDKVVKAFPADMSTEERAAFTDLRDHELIHSEFFRYLIGSKAVGGLTFNFDSLTLTTRAGVLAAAKQFEDLGVAAYIDACKRVTTADYLLLLGKITSVEARHAAYVRDALTANSFADDDVVVSFNGFGGFNDSKTPTEVATALAPYFTVTLITTSFS